MVSRFFNEWVAIAFHRLNMISPPTSAGGFGVYRDRVPYSSGWDLLRNVSNLPVSESNNPNPTSGFQLFPVPDKAVPVERICCESNASVASGPPPWSPASTSAKTPTRPT